MDLEKTSDLNIHSTDNLIKPKKYLNILFILGSILVGIMIGYILYPIMNGKVLPETIKSNEATPKKIENKSNTINITVSPEVSKTENPFCKQYGTFTMRFEDLLKVYTVGPGDSLRDIAKKELNDESKAEDFITVNPNIATYGVDDVLPMKMKIYVPNDKFLIEGQGAITYIKSRGNLNLNKDKPMFGISAPNSGTGPFIISDNIKNDINNLKEGDCIELIYGSRGYDPIKIPLSIKIQ